MTLPEPTSNPATLEQPRSRCWSASAPAGPCGWWASGPNSQPLHRLLDGSHGRDPLRAAGRSTVTTATQLAGGDELGRGEVTAAVPADHHLDPVFAQQRALGVGGERAPVADEPVPSGQRRRGPVDATRREPARRVGEGGEAVGPDREERALAEARSQRSRRGHVGHPVPVVARPGGPTRSVQHQQRQVQRGRSGDRGRRHPGRERVRGVDHRVGAVVAQPAGEPRDAAEPADAHVPSGSSDTATAPASDEVRAIPCRDPTAAARRRASGVPRGRRAHRGVRRRRRAHRLAARPRHRRGSTPPTRSRRA